MTIPSSWATSPDPVEAVPAATVILARDGRAGLEVLMVQRSSSLAFAGGMWVFPGGRVDPEDRDPSRPDDALAAARRAGAREVGEEAGLSVDPATLVPFSHWTPPPGAPKRFATWFFVVPAPAGTVTVDGGEIEAHRWVGPSDALLRHRRSEVELIPPTWITLASLTGFTDVDGLLTTVGAREPEVFVTKLAVVTDGTVALYDGDAGYADGDPERAGGRHRLLMRPGGWSYVRPDGTVVEP
jgi:8-oxo-dGTP pyrophosphatase MutT (NUDIX family)